MTYQPFNSNYSAMSQTCDLLIMQLKKSFIKRQFKREQNELQKTKDLRELQYLLTKVTKRLYLEEKAEAKEKIPEPSYEVPPAFDQAVLDFIHYNCADLHDLPDLPDIIVKAEKKIFGPGSPGPKKKWKKGKRTVKKEVHMLLKKNMLLASADCQSKKTAFAINVALKAMIEGKTPVIVTRRLTGDAEQFSRRCEEYARILNAFLDKNKVQDRPWEISTVLGIKLEQDKMKQQVAESFNGNYPRIIICLGNETQLERLQKLINQNEAMYKYYLIIDEIDNVDYGHESGAAKMLKTLKEQSYQTMGVTATPLDAIFSEPELKAVNQLRLTIPADYRGFIDIEVHPLKDNTATCLNHCATFPEIVKADSNLMPWLEMVSKAHPYFWWSEKKYNNTVMLLKNTRLNENQNIIYEGIKKKFRKDFALVVYNGKGIKCYHHAVDKIMGHPCGTYMQVSINEVLQYFKDGGVRKFPRILIIAGDMASRCISFVSKDYSLHLNDMYYLPSKATSIPEMIQSAGRQCGRNKGKGHIRLHAPKIVADALYHGFHFTDEVMKRAIADGMLGGGDDSFSDTIKQVKMNKEKMPKGRSLTGKVKVLKREYNLVKEEDDGHDIKTYAYKKIKLAKDGKVISEKEKTKKTKKTKKLKSEIPDDEFTRLTKKMFPVWAKADTKIALFMQDLDPRKVYTEKEMKSMLKNVNKNINNVMKKDNDKDYGKLFKQIATRGKVNYRLYPELVAEYENNFNYQEK